MLVEYNLYVMCKTRFLDNQDYLYVDLIKRRTSSWCLHV